MMPDRCDLLISKALLTQDKKETLAKLRFTLITGSHAGFRLLSKPHIFQSVVQREFWRGERLKYYLDTQTAERTELRGRGWMNTDSEGIGDQSDDRLMKTFLILRCAHVVSLRQLLML